jgi:hypothetical protein
MTETNVLNGVTASHLIGSRIEELAKAIKPDGTITDEELTFIFAMATEINPLEMSISVAETRQVRPYESNNYHASMKLGFGSIVDLIHERMRKAAPEDRAAIFTECKRTLYATIATMYSRNEDYLRELILRQQVSDGIVRG